MDGKGISFIVCKRIVRVIGGIRHLNADVVVARVGRLGQIVDVAAVVLLRAGQLVDLRPLAALIPTARVIIDGVFGVFGVFERMPADLHRDGDRVVRGRVEVRPILAIDRDGVGICDIRGIGLLDLEVVDRIARVIVGARLHIGVHLIAARVKVCKVAAGFRAAHNAAINREPVGIVIRQRRRNRFTLTHAVCGLGRKRRDREVIYLTPHPVELAFGDCIKFKRILLDGELGRFDRRRHKVGDAVGVFGIQERHFHTVSTRVRRLAVDRLEVITILLIIGERLGEHIISCCKVDGNTESIGKRTLRCAVRPARAGEFARSRDLGGHHGPRKGDDIGAVVRPAVVFIERDRRFVSFAARIDEGLLRHCKGVVPIRKIALEVIPEHGRLRRAVIGELALRE